MAKVYLSFLGLGQKQADGKAKYSETIYRLKQVKSSPTNFIQQAEIEIIGAEYFDKVMIVATGKSSRENFEDLKDRLEKSGVKNVFELRIEEEMSPENQWKWFEKILKSIEPGDHLTVDLTHGFRSIPIIFSTAINFLQKSRGIILEAAYYGAFDQRKDGITPIIDMKDFYVINEWADAVSSLVEDANARKMALAAQRTADFQAGELNDEAVIRAFRNLTDTVRNVDVNNVPEKAREAINLLEEKKRHASETGRILIDLVIDKFTSVAADEPLSGKYDRQYFEFQLEIIKLLLEHELYMQAYTAMREFIGSIGMIEIAKAKVSSSKGRSSRFRHAEVFVNMMKIAEKKWNFQKQNKDTEDVKDKLMPYFEKLKQIGVEPLLRSFVEDLADYRNGFDHAWTCRKEAYPDIREKGEGFLKNLEKVVQLLQEHKILT